MSSFQNPSKNDFDVIIIGAGISGINAAYRLKTQVPNLSYTILETRDGIGGTWDLFKYPGIRSDSDLYTFGFPWKPWKEQKFIADGASIVNYVRNTAASEGITEHVKFQHKVLSVDWSTEHQSWTVKTQVGEDIKYLHTRFLFMSTGYYDYNEALVTSITGIENFKGTVVHPQWWPEDLDYTGKKIVIIGSGATAVTLLPNLAAKAEKVTMLQRSPGYVMARAATDPFAATARKWLPEWVAHRLVRMKFLVLPFLFYTFCQYFPNAARSVIRKATLKNLPINVPHDPHFDPAYNPWQQRMCLSPDGDFYECLRDGKADVATGQIETVTEHGISLKSGDKLEADIIVTATGLKMQMAGGASILVDGVPLKIPEKFLWKGVMLQDMPNAAFVLGYTNASWTLGADATAHLVCRLLNHMQKNGYTAAVPRLEDPETMKQLPVLNLTSTYVTKGKSSLPMAGDKGPWKPRSNYFSDIWAAKYGDITAALQFYSVPT